MIPPAKELAQRFELLQTWSPQELEVLRSQLRERRLSGGELLLREGDYANCVYLLWEGELVVDLLVKGRLEEIGRIAPGSMVAEISLLDPGPATATVLAASTSTLFSLSREGLEQVHAMHPRAAANMLQFIARVMAARVRETTTRLEALRGMPEAEPAKPSLFAAMRSLIGLGRGRGG